VPRRGTARPAGGPASPDPATGDKSRLTALEGLAALSLDALSSVAYGPEAITVVLVAAGTAGLAYTLPVTVAITVLLAIPAIRRGTQNVVICRLRFQLTTWDDTGNESTDG
jgi:hypothetical protein